MKKLINKQIIEFAVTIITCISLSVIAGYMIYDHHFQESKPTVAYTVKQSNNSTVTYVPIQVLPIEKTITIDEKELQCMALNMYFEARNQKGEKPMAAVGYVVLNRITSSEFKGDNVCDIVYAGRKDRNGNYILHACQFSWVCDGKPDEPLLNNKLEIRAWEKAQEIAFKVLTGTIDNPVQDAVMYHADYVTTNWENLQFVEKIGNHLFYGVNS